MTGLKNVASILQKLKIESLNDMQIEARKTINEYKNVVLLSPTGTGKTLAFLIPIIENLDPKSEYVQVLILVPSRELAIQIEQVAREMGTGYKINAVYGGRPIAKDKIELAHNPAILIGTPGRIADHIYRGTFSTQALQTLVLDEFDKSLEIGFEDDMIEILDGLKSLENKILTSATQQIDIPNFVGLRNEQYLNFLDIQKPDIDIKLVSCAKKDKLEELSKLIHFLGPKRGIIFCNYKDTIQFVGDHLEDDNISFVSFYGGLEQKERERALIQFRNGSHPILLATDLAARGIDVPALDFIIHFQMPLKREEFVHRNGRTARMHKDGTSYILLWEHDTLKDYVRQYTNVTLPASVEQKLPKTTWTTLFISGGRKDKISKGDIAGLFFKQGGLKKGELGTIELKQDCAFVSVPKKDVRRLINALNNVKLKKKKVRIKTLEKH